MRRLKQKFCKHTYEAVGWQAHWAYFMGIGDHVSHQCVKCGKQINVKDDDPQLKQKL